MLDTPIYQSPEQLHLHYACTPLFAPSGFFVTAFISFLCVTTGENEICLNVTMWIICMQKKKSSVDLTFMADVLLCILLKERRKYANIVIRSKRDLQMYYAGRCFFL